MYVQLYNNDNRPIMYLFWKNVNHLNYVEEWVTIFYMQTSLSNLAITSFGLQLMNSVSLPDSRSNEVGRCKEYGSRWCVSKMFAKLVNLFLL